MPTLPLEQEIDALIEQSFALHTKDSERAHALVLQAQAMMQSAEQSGVVYSAGKANVDAQLAWLYQDRAEYELALKHGYAYLHSAESHEDTQYLPHVLGAMGVTFYRLGSIEKALDYFVRQLEVSEQLGDRWNVARAHLGFGLVYGNSDDFELAREHEAKSLEIYLELGDIERQATILNNMCYSACLQSSFNEAVELGSRGLALDPTGKQVGHIYGYLLVNMFDAHRGLGQLEQAREYVERAVALETPPSSDPFLHVMILGAHGRLALDLGQPEVAIAYLNTCAELSDKYSISLWQRVANFELYELHKQQGNLALALQHYESYHAADVKELKSESSVKLRAMTAFHQIEKEQKEAEILRLQTVELSQLVDEQTQRLRNSLEREKLLAQHLQQSYDRAEMLNELKSRVIEVVSHEFRTPLTTINNSATLIGQHLAKMSEKQRRNHVTAIQNAIVDLTALVSDVEIVGEANAESLSPVWLAQDLQHVCESLADGLAKAVCVPDRIVIEFDASINGVAVETDVAFVQKIGEALLTNALKFSSGNVIIRFSADSQKFTLSFSDNGIGIPLNEHDKLFMLLERCSNATAVRGLGVGLFLANQLAKTIFGQIRPISAGVNQGAQFIVELPLKRPRPD